MRITDTHRFLQEEMLLESRKQNISGVDWYIIVQRVGNDVTLKLHASHPSLTEWYRKVSVVFRENLGRSLAPDVIVIFSEKSPEWSLQSLSASINDHSFYSSSSVPIHSSSVSTKASRFRLRIERMMCLMAYTNGIPRL